MARIFRSTSFFCGSGVLYQRSYPPSAFGVDKTSRDFIQGQASNQPMGEEMDWGSIEMKLPRVLRVVIGSRHHVQEGPRVLDIA